VWGPEQLEIYGRQQDKFTIIQQSTLQEISISVGLEEPGYSVLCKLRKFRFKN